MGPHNMFDQEEGTPGKEAEKEWAVGRKKARTVWKVAKAQRRVFQEGKRM